MHKVSSLQSESDGSDIIILDNLPPTMTEKVCLMYVLIHSSVTNDEKQNNNAVEQSFQF